MKRLSARFALLLLFTLVTSSLSAEKKDKNKDLDKDNPGIVLVKSMLDNFTSMSQNRKEYIDGKKTYQQYMREDRRLSDIVSTYIDFYHVCEQSLKYDYDVSTSRFRSDHWAGRSQTEKNKFVAIFRQLIEAIVYPIAGEYFEDLEMRHKLVSETKDEIYLRTFIRNLRRQRRRDQEYVMEWYLHPRRSGAGWIIHDISIEDERWVPGFRSQFNDVISQRDYDELVKMMKDKLKEVLDDRKQKDLRERKEADEKRKAKKNKEVEKSKEEK